VNNIREQIKDKKKIVVKIGSSSFLQIHCFFAHGNGTGSHQYDFLPLVADITEFSHQLGNRSGPSDDGLSETVFGIQSCSGTDFDD